MMDRIIWTDSTCTVGWTNICVSMSHHEFPWLLKHCPKGHFSACFYTANYDCSTELGYIEYLEAKLYSGDNIGMFYFEFPLDRDGLILLKELCLVNPDVEIEDVKRSRRT